MRVKISKGQYRDLTEAQINQLAFVAWHVAFPGPYDGKPSEPELKQIARDAIGSPQHIGRPLP